MKKSVTYFVMALCLTLFTFGKAFAQAGGIFSPTNSTITMPTSVLVRASDPVGTLLWTSPTVTSNLNGGIATQAFMAVGVTTPVLGTGNNLAYYPTGIAGIGLQWKVKMVGPNYPNGADFTFGAGTLGGQTGAGITLRSTTYTQEVYAELRKTGNVPNSSSMGFPTGNLLRLDFNCVNGFCTPWFIGLTGTTSVVVAPSCAVRVPNQTVNLGQASVANFTGQNSTTIPIPFSIDLTCSGGASGSRTNAYITMTDSTATNNRGNVLTLSGGGGKAVGVGVQIKRENGTIVSYGPDSDAIPNTNQWLASTISGPISGERVVPIKLTASHVQTAASTSAIRAGTANARATFNITYN